MLPPRRRCSGSSEAEREAAQTDAHSAPEAKCQLRFLLGENVWEDLEQQVAAFRVQQEESKRVLASIAREQESFIAELHGFIKDRAQAESARIEPEASQHGRRSRQRGGPADSEAAGADGRGEPLPESGARTEADPEPDPTGSTGMDGGAHAQEPAKRTARMTTASQSGSSEDWGNRDTLRASVDDPRLVTVALSHYSNRKKQSVRAQVEVPPIKDGVVAWIRAASAWLLAWRFFEPMMAGIIGLNAANIGWSIDRELQGRSISQQEMFETFFLGIFCVELALRILVRGCKCLKVPANAFDFVLVAVTMLAQVSRPLLELWGSGDAVRYLDQLMILRMMRLLRLVRAVRLVASFRSLWKLVQGLVHCFPTMVSAMLLILISIYIFACFGAELISKPLAGDSEVGHIIRGQFNTLPHIFLTLFQFISMDSTAAIYVPLIHRSPALCVYFLLLLVLIAIALMNLITALIVEEAISSAQMDEEMRSAYTREKLKSVTPALHQLFQSLDSSGDGVVEIKELVETIHQGIQIPEELQGMINPARMLDLFEALDSDKSGNLSEAEFVEGLSCVALSDVTLETMQILHLLRSLRNDVRHLQSVQMSSSRGSVRRSCDLSNARDGTAGDCHHVAPGAFAGAGSSLGRGGSAGDRKAVLFVDDKGDVASGLEHGRRSEEDSFSF